MDRLEFEADLRRDGYRVVNSSVKPNLVAPNHCHDFDAKAFVLGGEITITCDNSPVTFRAGQCFEVPSGCMHAEHVGPEGVALLSGRRRNGGPLTRERSKATYAGKALRSFMEGRRPTLPKTCTHTTSTCGSWCSAVRSPSQETGSRKRSGRAITAS